MPVKNSQPVTRQDLLKLERATKDEFYTKMDEVMGELKAITAPLIEDFRCVL